MDGRKKRPRMDVVACAAYSSRYTGSLEARGRASDNHLPIEYHYPYIQETYFAIVENFQNNKLTFWHTFNFFTRRDAYTTALLS